MSQRNHPAPPETVDELFPVRWVRPGDVTNRPTVQITRFTWEKLFIPQENKKRWCYVIWFGHKNGEDKLTELSKQLVLTKTRATALVTIAGHGIIGEWVGMKIQLAPGINNQNKPTVIITAAPPERQTKESEQDHA